MKTTLKNGKQATLTIDTKTQTATVTTEGVNKLVAFSRDNKIIIKNDMLLTNSDLLYVKTELAKILKPTNNSPKAKR